MDSSRKGLQSFLQILHFRSDPQFESSRSPEAKVASEELLDRIVSDPQVCGGEPQTRGARILVATILDGLVEGLSAEQITDHFPSLNADDIRAAVVYRAELARENTK